MTDKTLLNYIKQTLASGFSEQQIRQTLKQTGWAAGDVEQAFTETGTSNKAGLGLSMPDLNSFWNRHRKLMLIVLAVIVLLPLVVYAALAVYRQLALNSTRQNPGLTAGIQLAADKEQQEARDLNRLEDIQNLQKALEKYFTAYKKYPPALQNLAKQGLVVPLPLDPSSNQPYLYTALGEVSLNYSLSFILETKIGTLNAGLNAVTADDELLISNIKNRHALIKGEAALRPSAEFAITDLSQTSFYPGEEVLVEVSPQPGLELELVMLVINDLKLSDINVPFGFRFTAPAKGGEYPVRIFGFDRAGLSYFQNTTLRIQPLNR